MIARRDALLENQHDFDIFREENRRKENIIIFDWDDTLMFSTWIEKNNKLVENNKDDIEECENSAYSLLENAIQSGIVYIVSNGTLMWIVYSCSTYMPKLVPLLSKVHLVSCRDLYEATEPDVDEWKKNAFKTIAEDHCNQFVNIISIGDSVKERSALLSLEVEDGINTKSIKMMENPSLPILYKQQQFILSQFQYILDKQERIDYQLNFKND